MTRRATAEKTRKGKGWTAPGPKSDKFQTYIRFVDCASALQDAKQLTPADSKWLAGILTKLCLGQDVRPLILDAPTRGRVDTSSTRDFWLTVDAHLETKASGRKDKVLWGVLSDRWGIADRTIGNILRKNREFVEHVFATGKIEEYAELEISEEIAEAIAEHKKSA